MAVEQQLKEKSDGRYYVTVEGQVRGPFDLDLIEAMVLSGNFPPGVPVCKVGSQEWSPLPPSPRAATPTWTAGQPTKSNRSGGTKRVGAVVVGIIVILFVVGAFLNNQQGTQPSAAQQPAPTYNSSPAPLQNTPPSTTDYRDPAGRTYRVPDWVHRDLLAKESSINAQEASLNSLKSEVEALRNQIESKRPYLDKTSQYAVDAFNEEVHRYNALNQQLKEGIDAFNASVDDYNTELVRFGTPID
jgi:GYF domain 2